MSEQQQTFSIMADAERDPTVNFDSVADGIGKTISTGILGRIASFPTREARLHGKSGKMDSLPEDILWEGLGEESAPIFVVYKLIHEAFSNAPQFFRSALVEFLRAQPDRFSAVFNRETVWSVMAALPADAAPGKLPGHQGDRRLPSASTTTWDMVALRR